MNGSEVFAPVAVEGSVDFFLGRPLDANPYSRESGSASDPASAWSSWRFGWLEGARLGELRRDEESRWNL